MRLGTVKPVTVVALDQCPNIGGGATVGTVECSSGRLEQLCGELNLPLDSLSPDEAEQLRNLIREFSDVFALDDSELGCTDVLCHSVDTGNHLPIKQQPYRTPVVTFEK